MAKKPVNEDNVKKILSSAGVSVDEARVKALISAISEVNIDEAIKSAPVGFGAPAPVAAPSESKPEPKEKKEDQKKKEEEALS
ncbi:MAG: 50S ribosomal protein L12, partial [Candidatus Bathyarchaeia archaeon]